MQTPRPVKPGVGVEALGDREDLGATHQGATVAAGADPPVGAASLGPRPSIRKSTMIPRSKATSIPMTIIKMARFPAARFRVSVESAIVLADVENEGMVIGEGGAGAPKLGAGTFPGENCAPGPGIGRDTPLGGENIAAEAGVGMGACGRKAPDSPLGGAARLELGAPTRNAPDSPPGGAARLELGAPTRNAPDSPVAGAAILELGAPRRKAPDSPVGGAAMLAPGAPSRKAPDSPLGGAPRLALGAPRRKEPDSTLGGAPRPEPGAPRRNAPDSPLGGAPRLEPGPPRRNAPDSPLGGAARLEMGLLIDGAEGCCLARGGGMLEIR